MSFSSMMESGRGPGVIGTLLALLVLGGFAILYLFVFDGGMQGGMSISAEVARQESDISTLKEEIRSRGKSVAKIPVMQAAANDLRQIKQENQFREGSINGLNKSISDIGAEIEGKLKEFEAYKDRYRAFVRGKAKGQVIERIETLKGAVYTNCTMKEVSAVGIQIQYDGGIKRIPYEELPADMQDLYQFDAKQRDAALAAERAARNQHEAQVDATQQAKAAKAEERKLAELEAARKNRARALSVAESRIVSLGQEISSLEIALHSEENKTVGRAPEVRQQLAAKQAEYSALKAEALRLRTEQ